MRISLLREREPFPEILTRTLERFLPQITGKQHRVRWAPIFRSRDAAAQRWLCNPYLNAIFAKGASPAVLEPVVREFSRSPSLWRRPFQRAYVAVASSGLGAPVLAPARLEIAPPLTDAADWLIVAGNHKIRLLNSRTLRCYAVLKEGFEAAPLLAEVEARQLAAKSGVSIPRLRETADDGTWLLEDYVTGTPLNRLPDDDIVRGTLREVMRELNRLADATSRRVEVSAYAASLADAARRDLAAARAIDDPLRGHIEGCLSRATQALEPFAADEIETARCHGDLQPGNVLWHRNGHWLIDWEYAARRQTGHDRLVYCLRTRFPDGLADRLRQFVEHGLGDEDDRDSATRRRAALFLGLEELAVRLGENRNPHFVSVGRSFGRVVDEFDAWLRMESTGR